MLVKKHLPTTQQFWVTMEWPDVSYTLVIIPAQPIADPIPCNCPSRSHHQCGFQRKSPHGNHCSDAEHEDGTWYQKPDKCQRFKKRYHENQQIRRMGVVSDNVHDGFQGHRISILLVLISCTPLQAWRKTSRVWEDVPNRLRDTYHISEGRNYCFSLRAND